MTIQEAAAASGLSIDTIRFYEKAGMTSPVPRGCARLADLSAIAGGMADELGALARNRYADGRNAAVCQAGACDAVA